MTPLKLAALDATDLAVLSAHLQDALGKVSDIDYRAGAHEFALALNRFAWEAKGGGFFRPAKPERRRTILQFARVMSVKTVGIDRTKGEDVLSLLALRFHPGEAPAGTVELVFSGNAAIRLEVECIEARLADLGGAWEAASRPVHRV
ncbi:MAG: DUF2948 domain-containing protein [Mesorhizobium amorphae]|nr:MAG: DUF2948 domain-containing protein [Mesorhizobium amorphae]